MLNVDGAFSIRPVAILHLTPPLSAAPHHWSEPAARPHLVGDCIVNKATILGQSCIVLGACKVCVRARACA
jgi:hypothetical protein